MISDDRNLPILPIFILHHIPSFHFHGPSQPATPPLPNPSTIVHRTRRKILLVYSRHVCLAAVVPLTGSSALSCWRETLRRACTVMAEMSISAEMSGLIGLVSGHNSTYRTLFATCNN